MTFPRAWWQTRLMRSLLVKSSKPSAITAAPSSSIGPGLAGSGRHHHGAHSLDGHRPEAPADLPPGRFVADSPLEEAVRSEPVSEMDLRDNARFRGVYRIVTRDENACFRVIGGIFKTGAAARSLGFCCLG